MRKENEEDTARKKSLAFRLEKLADAPHCRYFNSCNCTICPCKPYLSFAFMFVVVFNVLWMKYIPDLFSRRANE